MINKEKIRAKARFFKPLVDFISKSIFISKYLKNYH